MRSSKSKAYDVVKQWCGSMNDEDHESKYKFIKILDSRKNFELTKFTCN